MITFNDSLITINNHLNSIDKIFLYIGILIAPIIFLCCLISIFLVIKLEWKRFHPNFCILHLNLLVTLLYISLGHTMLCSICIKEDLSHPVENQKLYGIVVMMGNFGATLLRCLWIAIFIERTVATIYRNFYEQKTKCGIVLSIGLSLGCYLITGLIEYCFFYNIIDLNYTQGFVFIMDIMAISSISILSKYNKKLRQLNARSDVKLSQRYQLSENIRALKIILPIIKIGVVLTISGTILMWISFKIEIFYWAFRYTSMIYFTFVILYALITIILWVKNDVSYRRLFFKLWMKIFRSNMASKVQPTIVNTDGKVIPKVDHAEVHFESLKHMWN